MTCIFPIKRNLKLFNFREYMKLNLFTYFNMSLNNIRMLNNYNNKNFHKLHYLMLLEMKYYFNNY